MKKGAKVIAVTALALGVAFFATLAPVDHTPFKESEFFEITNKTLDTIERQPVIHEGDTLRAGWSKVNLTPPFKTSLAGYGAGKAETVSDSIWVRVFVFDNRKGRVALIAPDLLIFPPVVKKKLNRSLKDLGLDMIFYTATHTHHSIGNWQKGMVGRIFAGPYDEKVVGWIENQTLSGIAEAKNNLKRSKIAFAAIHAENLVYNRLVGESGAIDPWLRLIKFEQDSGSTAVITSFSAHPTTFPRNVKSVHRDYPGMLVNLIENTGSVDFSAFIAGAVGSQGPNAEGTGEQKMELIAADLTSQIGLILNVIQPVYTTTLGYLSADITLREPHLRISSSLRLRPWLFNLLFNEYQATIDGLRLGDIILVGTPCDFSGELVAPLEKEAREENLNLITTSFNGGYIGYITKDDWYELDEYETRKMNWFGPENGAYFSYLVRRMTKIMSGKNGGQKSIPGH